MGVESIIVNDNTAEELRKIKEELVIIKADVKQVKEDVKIIKEKCLFGFESKEIVQKES